VRIRIHLVARLLKVPILRVDGDILLRDGDDVPVRVPSLSTAPPVGRLLASAEADLDGLDRRRGAVRRRAG
jgi:hypothetical protein